MTSRRSLPRFRVDETVRIRTDLTDTEFEGEHGIICGCSQDHLGGYAYAVCNPISGMCCVFTESELVPEGSAVKMTILGQTYGDSLPTS